MKILWAGPYFSEYAFTVKRSLNIAATVWSHGFVKGLQENGCNVHVVTLCPEQAWPAGRVIWQGCENKLFDHDVPVTPVPYLNVAYLREKWQSFFFARKVRTLLSQEKFDAFVCYNVLHPYHVAAMREAKSLGVPVFPIVLDGGYDVVQKGFGEMSRCARYADGVVFLSQWCRDNFPSEGRRLLQMEGGVTEWNGKIPQEKDLNYKKVVTYAGAFTAHRGQGLVEMVRSCKRDDVRFIICGKWNMTEAIKAFGGDPRVELRGMVSSRELKEIYDSTDIFINSRENGWGHNFANFPSKVSAYLGYGRPIVSNWIDSFPCDYRNLLCVSDDDSGVSMARKLDEVLDWSLKEREECYYRLKHAYQQTKSWKMQAKRFIGFISDERKDC